MKTNYTLHLTFFLGLLLTSGPFAPGAVAQEKVRTRMKVYTEKKTNNDRLISIVLIKGRGKNMAGVQDANVTISTLVQEDETDLATILTDINGEAELIISAGYKLPLNENGFTIIKATYAGNDSIKAASKQIKFVNLNIDVSFDIIDSAKYVNVSTYEIDSLGNKIPSEGVSISVGVQRLYSILPLKKIKTNEEGMNSMEFPDDIPGDSIGNLNVIVKVSDNRRYGSITKVSEINWGTLVDYSYTHNERSLYGEQAPLWMIIAVLVILLGAWYHFILAIVLVLRIKSTDQKEAF